MAQDMALFDDNSSLPAHLLGAFGKHNDELSSGVSGGYAVLSIKGKTWALSEGGTRTIIKREDGDPASSIEVVIIKANPHLSKVYYEGGYTEGSEDKPVCYSNDSIAPALDAARPQCQSCAACPHNVWGSRISENGSKGKACADSRRIAVVPSGQLDHLMLLRVPAATLKDLSVYADLLTRRNAPYQAVVTKIGFDPEMAHPKLTFKAIRWLAAEEASQVLEAASSDVAAQIVGNVARVQDEAVAALPAQRPTASAARPAPAPAARLAPAPVVAAPAAVIPRGAFGGGPAVAKPAAPADEVEKKAPKTTKKGAFASTPIKAVAPEPATRAAQAVTNSTDDLDAALAELDDL